MMTKDRGHARKETRSITVLNLIAAQLAVLRVIFPGATQLIRMVRTRTTLARVPVPRARTARKPRKKGKAGKARKVKVRETVSLVTD